MDRGGLVVEIVDGQGNRWKDKLSSGVTTLALTTLAWDSTK